MAATPVSERPARARAASPHAGAGRDVARVPIRRVLAVLRPYFGQLVVAALLLIASNGLGLVFPLIIRSLLNSILSQRDERLLNGVVLVLIAVSIVQMLLSAVEGYLVTSLGERLSFDLRTRLFGHLQLLPLNFFDHRRTGELMSRVTNDV